MTEQEIEAAISDAYHELAECMPPQALGCDHEQTDLGWFAKCALSDTHDKRHNWLVSRALSGSRHTHDVLCDIACELTWADKPMPLWLQRYIVRAARNGGGRAERGRDPRTNLVRDQVIAWAVHFISRRYNLNPTRNAATDIECGCSIVAEALRRPKLHIEMKEATIAAIWQRVGAFVERVPPVSILLPSDMLLDNQALLEAQVEAHRKGARRVAVTSVPHAYKAWRSTRNHAAHMICCDGEFDNLPEELRRMGPWIGFTDGDIDRLKPEYRSALARHGFVLVFGGGMTDSFAPEVD
jgi:hypothetical protein